MWTQCNFTHGSFYIPEYIYIYVKLHTRVNFAQVNCIQNRYLTEAGGYSSEMDAEIFEANDTLWTSKQYEPRHDKINKMSVRPAKTQFSLGIRPGWSESSLGAHSLCWFCHVVAHIMKDNTRKYHVDHNLTVCFLHFHPLYIFD